MGGDYELGKNYNILGEKYEVIGCSGVEFEEREAWMWIEQCPDGCTKLLTKSKCRCRLIE